MNELIQVCFRNMVTYSTIQARNSPTNNSRYYQYMYMYVYHYDLHYSLLIIIINFYQLLLLLLLLVFCSYQYYYINISGVENVLSFAQRTTSRTSHEYLLCVVV